MTTFPQISIADHRSDSKATIAPDRGAIVTSFTVAGRELLYLDQSTFIEPGKNVRGGIPILFPSPGKLANDQWQTQGRTGNMKQHGFARTMPWKVGFVAERTVLLQLDSDATTLAQYPWPFRAQLELTLEGTRLRLSMNIDNTGASAMPFALGYHPYFIVKDKARARIDTDATRQFDNLTKVVGSFRGFDLTAREIDQHLLDQRAHEVPLVLADGSRIDVSASQDFSHWVVWSLADKEFVCVEPWTAPGNALNTGERLLRLEPGQAHRSFMQIEFRIG